MNWLVGKHVLITGGTSGIGLEVVRSCVGIARKISIIARNEKKLLEIKEEVSMENTIINIEPLDVCDTKGIKQLVNEIYNNGDQVDSFVNCAGGSHVISLFKDMSHDDIDVIMDTNAKSVLHWLLELLPRMENHSSKGDDKKAHIVLLSSRSGERILPRLVPYAVAKGAVEKIAQGLQREFGAYKIAFTLINPGSINTAFTDNWNSIDRDAHNNESLSLDQVNPIIMDVLKSPYLIINKVSFESIDQLSNELGVLKQS